MAAAPSAEICHIRYGQRLSVPSLDFLQNNLQAFHIRRNIMGASWKFPHKKKDQFKGRSLYAKFKSRLS